MFGSQGAGQQGTPFDFDAFFRPGGDSGFNHHAHFNFHSMFDDFFDDKFFQNTFGGDYFQESHHQPDHHHDQHMGTCVHAFMKLLIHVIFSLIFTTLSF